MKEYSYQEMLKMQEEAADRVRAMQKRSVFAAQDARDEFERDTYGHTDFISRPAETGSEEKPSSENRQETDNSPARKGLLDFLRNDGDSALIIAIMALLSGEETDPSLMMALAYILL